MLKTLSFPSVSAPVPGGELSGLEKSREAFLLRCQHADHLVGVASLSAPSPQDISPFHPEYELFARVGLLLADPADGMPVCLTVGFPHSLLGRYGDRARKSLAGIGRIEFSVYPVCQEYVSRDISIQRVEVVSRIRACAETVRREMAPPGDFLTVDVETDISEAILTGPSGEIAGPVLGLSGIGAFSAGKISGKDGQVRAYYEEVLSPGFHSVFPRRERACCTGIYLSGKGASLPALAECFRRDFGERVPVKPVYRPLECASRGYCYLSRPVEDAGGGPERILCVGMDIGRARTRVSVYYGDRSERCSSCRGFIRSL